ncbi:MAG: phospholipase D-like domain-containing protein [Myxococcota bacterium]
MLEEIQGAQKQVIVEMYWFDDDSVGQRFATALCQAALSGREVAVMVDALGSLGGNAILERLRKAGVSVIEFNPVAPWRKRFRLERVTRRNHRKMIAVDGQVAFVGGVNIADPWQDVPPDRIAWRDDTLRLKGACVTPMIVTFHQLWSRQGGRTLSTPSAPSYQGPYPVQILEQVPLHKRQISRAIRAKIRQASSRVWIAQAYFLPSGSLIRALEKAAARGVDVRVVVPGKSDFKTVQWATRSLYSRLFKSQIRIYEFLVSMLHSKTVLVDNAWLCTGSFNFDNRSYQANHELNVAVDSLELANVAHQRFLKDFDKSHEITPNDYRDRSLGRRVLEFICFSLDAGCEPQNTWVLSKIVDDITNKIRFRENSDELVSFNHRKAAKLVLVNRFTSTAQVIVWSGSFGFMNHHILHGKPL